MVQAFCTNGNHERVKGTVHGAAGVIAALMAVYNLAACRYRHDRHLRVNALIYTAAVGWEIRQTLRHLRRHPVAVVSCAGEALVNVDTA